MQTSDLPSLLDDAGFVVELERFERLPKLTAEETPITDAQLNAIEEVSRPSENPTARGFDEQAQRRAHAALERALEPEYHAQQHPRRHHSHVPRAIVALVLLLGFATGAGAAALIFHDRVVQVVVQRIHIK